MKKPWMLKPVCTLALAFILVSGNVSAISIISGQTAASESPHASIVQENVTKRKENEKHFLCEDGSYIAATYPYPVHEQSSSGDWVEVDNTLTWENGRISNRNTAFRTTFAPKANPDTVLASTALANSSPGAPTKQEENRLVQINSGTNTLSWSLTGISLVPVQINEKTMLNPSSPPPSASTESLDKSQNSTGPVPLFTLKEHSLSSVSSAQIEPSQAMAPSSQKDAISDYEKTVVEKAVSSVLYPDALGSGVDLQYTVASYRIKEDIILRQRSCFRGYTMHVDADGLTAVKTEDNRIEFLDEYGQVIFTVHTPYMYDDAQEESTSIAVTLEQEGDDCTITFVPNQAWLTAPERVYPVTIDPETSSQYQSSISDTYVHEGDGNCCNGITPSTYNRLYIGNKGGQLHRAYLKINDLPTIPAGSYINSSTLFVQCYAGTSTSKPFSLNKVTSTWWDASTLSWDPQPASVDIEYNVERDPGSNKITFSNLRDTIAGMYNGNIENGGFMIHYTDETQQDYNSIYSYENINTSGHPYLWVSYRERQNYSDGYYYIRNKNSGQYLDVPNWGESETNLEQFGFNGGTNQRWIVQPQSNGLYVIKPEYNTNLALDVRYGVNENDIPIWVYDYNDTAAQQWYIIPNADGSCRILSRVSNGMRGLAVYWASQEWGAAIIHYTYTEGENSNDDWYLEPADSIAELTVFSLPNGGHSWLTIKNNLGTNIMVGVFSVAPEKEISIGTFGNQSGHNGIWYNIESWYADSASYNGRVSLSQNINYDQLSTINDYIENHDTWSLYNNCSNFAANVWNSVSDSNLKFSFWPTPSALSNEIKNKDGYETNRKFQKAESEDIGYKNNSSSFYSAGSSSLSGSSSS